MIIKQIFIHCTLLFFILNIHPAFSSGFDVYYDSIYSDIHYRYFTNSDYSFNDNDIETIRKLYQLDCVKNNPVNQARVQYIHALIEYCALSPNYEKALNLLDSSLMILSKEKHPKDYAKLLAIKGAIYVDSRKSFTDAYRYFIVASDLLNHKNDAPFTALIYNYTAMLWTSLGEYENAIEYIKKSERIFKQSGYETTAYFVRSNSYSIYIRMGKCREIMADLRNDLDFAIAKKDTSSILFLNILSGNNYALVNEYDKALHHLSEANNLIKVYSSPSGLRKADLYYSLGRLLFYRKDYKEAIKFLEQSFPYIQQFNMLGYESKANYFLSQIYDEYGNKELAYKYLHQSIILNDSLAIQEKSNEIQRIKNHTELMNYRQQLQIAQQKSEIERTRAILIIVMLVFVLLIIVFILFYINRKKQLRELKIKQLNQKLENEEVSNKLEKLKLEKQMEEKEREIATTQLLISEKNKVLKQMLDAFKPYYLTKEISEKAWKKMETFVSSNLWKENEWEKSKIHFEKVHPDFFKNLKAHCPDLTENDLRLCAYIRIGMRNKQIAEMLSIDPKSVISNRYHLKKKIKLTKEESLDDFIRDI